MYYAFSYYTQQGGKGSLGILLTPPPWLPNVLNAACGLSIAQLLMIVLITPYAISLGLDS